MSYDSNIIDTINEKYRQNALEFLFLGFFLFWSQPNGLPSPLALVHEVDANHERYMLQQTLQIEQFTN